MLQTIKEIIWESIAEKGVSLCMIFSKSGQILWAKGRAIQGRTIQEGNGFCKSLISKALQHRQTIREMNFIMNQSLTNLSLSAQSLRLKTVLILPLTRDYFLYMDSGTRATFTTKELTTLETLAEVMKNLLNYIHSVESESGGISGSSPAVKAIRQQVLSFSIEEEPVLLCGETGTGKSRVARLIHSYSGRKGRFVAVHTPGIQETLFESEIFGHCKGAFTGADATKPGLVEEARGGTLFFDEISEAPLAFQTKLLRFLDDFSYRRVGDTREQTADVRLIFATNRDLAAEVQAGRFRRDLFYRLNVLCIHIPPLRERLEDIADLVKDNQTYLRGKRISGRGLATLQSHAWPGNIRELFNVLKRAGISGPKHIGSDIQTIISKNTQEPSGADQTVAILQKAIDQGRSFWQVVKPAFLDRSINRDQAREIVHHAVAKAGGSYKNALTHLQIPVVDYKKFMNFLTTHKLR